MHVRNFLKKIHTQGFKISGFNAFANFSERIIYGLDRIRKLIFTKPKQDVKPFQGTTLQVGCGKVLRCEVVIIPSPWVAAVMTLMSPEHTHFSLPHLSIEKSMQSSDLTERFEVTHRLIDDRKIPVKVDGRVGLVQWVGTVEVTHNRAVY